MLIIKSINLSILCALLSMGLYVRPALAKPISNTLRSTVNVTSTSSTDVGDGYDSDNTDNEVDNNYININNAINATNEGGTLKIKSGEYRLDYITSKNITIECADVNGYVDILTVSALPAGIKIKVGERVTINQEGVNPVNLLFGINKTANGSPAVLSGNEIRLNVGQGEEVIIKVRQEIKNKLGFHDLKTMLKVNNVEDVIVSRTVNNVFQTFTPEEGVYNLGRISDYPTDTLIKFKFTSGGEYIMELWADDGR